MRLANLAEEVRSLDSQEEPLNGVPEHIREDIAATSVTDTDRRHGIKLVSCKPNERLSRFRIEVEEGLFSNGTDYRRTVSGTDEMLKSDQALVIGSAVALAALAGFAIGLFIGRRHDDQ